MCSVGEAVLRERGGSELLMLERFDVATSFSSLGTDAARMGHAAYVAEVLAKLCAPGQAEPAIFDLAVSVLTSLDTEGVSPTRLRIFELALLAHLGFAPSLDDCAVCGRSDLSVGETIDVRFIPDRGGVVCWACASRGRPMRPVVRVALSNLSRTPLTDAVNVNLPPDVERGCRDALRELIAVHLSAPLRSLEFLSKLENPAPSDSRQQRTAGGASGPLRSLPARGPT